ncbi:uncharacterized protein LOC144101866 [Amblyomma americanum]
MAGRGWANLLFLVVLFVACLVSSGMSKSMDTNVSSSECSQLMKVVKWCGEKKHWKNELQRYMAKKLASEKYGNEVRMCLSKALNLEQNDSYCEGEDSVMIFLMCSQIALFRVVSVPKKFPSILFHNGYEHCVKQNMGFKLGGGLSYGMVMPDETGPEEPSETDLPDEPDEPHEQPDKPTGGGERRPKKNRPMGDTDDSDPHPVKREQSQWRPHRMPKRDKSRPDLMSETYRPRPLRLPPEYKSPSEMTSQPDHPRPLMAPPEYKSPPDMTSQPDQSHPLRVPPELKWRPYRMSQPDEWGEWGSNGIAATHASKPGLPLAIPPQDNEHNNMHLYNRRPWVLPHGKPPRRKSTKNSDDSTPRPYLDYSGPNSSGPRSKYPHRGVPASVMEPDNDAMMNREDNAMNGNTMHGYHPSMHLPQAIPASAVHRDEPPIAEKQHHPPMHAHHPVPASAVHRDGEHMAKEQRHPSMHAHHPVPASAVHRDREHTAEMQRHPSMHAHHPVPASAVHRDGEHTAEMQRHPSMHAHHPVPASAVHRDGEHTAERQRHPSMHAHHPVPASAVHRDGEHTAEMQRHPSMHAHHPVPASAVHRDGEHTAEMQRHPSMHAHHPVPASTVHRDGEHMAKKQRHPSMHAHHSVPASAVYRDEDFMAEEHRPRQPHKKRHHGGKPPKSVHRPVPASAMEPDEEGHDHPATDVNRESSGSSHHGGPAAAADPGKGSTMGSKPNAVYAKTVRRDNRAAPTHNNGMHDSKPHAISHASNDEHSMKDTSLIK